MHLTAQPAGGSQAARRIDITIISLLVCLILYSPLPFGSVQASSILLIEATACLCFLLWCIRVLTHAHQQSLLMIYQQARNGDGAAKK